MTVFSSYFRGGQSTQSTFARAGDGLVGGGQPKHQHGTSDGEFPNDVADHDRPLDCLREWLGNNLAVRRPDVADLRVNGLIG